MLHEVIQCLKLEPAAGLMLPMEDLLRLAKELKDHLLACAPQPAPVAPKQQEGSPSKGRKRKEAPHTETNTSMTVNSFFICNQMSRQLYFTFPRRQLNEAALSGCFLAGPIDIPGDLQAQLCAEGRAAKSGQKEIF